MNNIIEFFLPMKPPTKTHQMKRVSCKNGTPVFYEDNELKAVRKKLQGHLAKYRPENEITGPIRLITKWCFPLAGKHVDGEFKTSKPDTDNTIKLLKDVMTTLGYWKDDAQVASEITEKFWAKIPGLYVKVIEL